MDTKNKQRTLKRKCPKWNEKTLGQRPDISQMVPTKRSSLSRAPLRDLKNTSQLNNPTTSCTELGSDQNQNRSPDDRTTSLTPVSPACLPLVSPLLPEHSHQNVCPSSAPLPIYNCSNGSILVAPQVNNNNAGGSFIVNVTVKDPQTDPSALASQRSAMCTDDSSLQKVKENNAATMKKRAQNLFEATSIKPTRLNDIFIDVHITEGETVANENEVLGASQGQTIEYNDLFKPLPGQDNDIRTVMTKGDAGTGKTVIVQKFILDWADKLTNKDLEFVFSFPVRSLNFVKGPQSLISLLKGFHKELNDTPINFNTKTTLIILDGLDESTLPFNFKDNDTLTNETQEAPVDVLITNLLKGNLLPEACIWITLRPAAAKQIPRRYISRVTELHGFNDNQIEEYLRKKFSSDENLCLQVISHIKKTKSLHTMCRMPVFSCISAIVLKEKMTNCREDIPKTLTQMYTHFLLIQINLKNAKYFEECEIASHKMKESDKQMILKLAKLAFENLEKGKILFSEEDLKEYSIDISEASVQSGLCTGVLIKEYGLLCNSVVCFVHLTVQELFAALYLLNRFAKNDFEVLRSFLCMEFVKQAKAESPDALLGYNSQSSEDTSEDESSSLEEESEELINALLDNESKESRMYSKKISLHDLPLHVLLKSAVYRALKSKNGHLDIMLRFLLGLSLEQNRRLLEELLPQMDKSAESLNETKEYITECLDSKEFNERCINLLSCLAEMGDHTLHEKVQKCLRAGSKLTPSMCTTLAYIKSMEVSDVYDLSTNKTTEEGRKRLLPTLQYCRRAILAGCNISEDGSYEIIASALKSPNSVLLELDLSYNDLQHSSIWPLYDGLQSLDCKLKILCLKQCNLTARECHALVNALGSNQSLRELDLADNDLQDPGVKFLTMLSRLESLSLSSCGATEESCASLSAALCSNSLQLNKLDLSDNDLGDTGVKLLSKGLANQNCKLQILRLTGCLLTVDSCDSLAEALRSNTCMKLLDVCYNHLEDTGVKILASGQRTQIKSDYNNKCYLKPGKKKYACEMSLDPYTASDQLILSEEDKMVLWVDEEQYCRPHPGRFITCPQVLCREVPLGRHYWEVKWEGRGAHVGVAYKTINRKQEGRNCLLGYNDQSWTFNIYNSGRVKLSAWHNNESKDIEVPLSDTDKVGVYLNQLQGTLSFYGVTSDSQTHLHTFRISKFTGPLCPAFWVCPSPGSSILLC